MEISKKYSWDEISDLAVAGAFETCKTFTDQKSYFTDVVWEAR
jgi:uncharacterized SAM-dependent methyltransferase